MILRCDNVYTYVDADVGERSILELVLKSPDDDQKSFLLKKGDDYVFFTGLLSWVLPNLKHYGVCPTVINDPSESASVTSVSDDLLSFEDFKLRDYQLSTVSKAISNIRGILVLGTGAGKSEIAAGIVRHLLDSGEIKRAIVVVPSSQLLLQQMYARLIKRGFSEQEVGRVGSGFKDHDRPVTVAIVNSIHTGYKKRDPKIMSILSSADLLIFDETHHLSSMSWVEVASACPAKYRFGLTATFHDDPKKLTQRDVFLIGLTGPVCVKVSARYLISRGYLAEPITFMYPFDHPRVRVSPTNPKAWHLVFKRGIVENVPRNNIILGACKSLYDHGHKIIIFVAQISHGAYLLRELSDAGVDRCVFATGGNSIDYYESGRSKKVHWNAEELTQYVELGERSVLIVNQVGDEGLDIPSSSALIIAGGRKKYRLTVQRAGRGMRPKDLDNRVFIVDFMDDIHPFLRAQSNYREWSYREESFTLVSQKQFDEALGFSVDYSWRNRNEVD